MAPRHLTVNSFEAHWYLFRTADTLVDLFLERDIIKSLTIIEENEVGLSCLYLFYTAAVQAIVTPGSFIDSAIVNPEDSSAIPLPLNMLAHVSVQFMIE